MSIEEIQEVKFTKQLTYGKLCQREWETSFLIKREMKVQSGGIICCQQKRKRSPSSTNFDRLFIFIVFSLLYTTHHYRHHQVNEVGSRCIHPKQYENGRIKEHYYILISSHLMVKQKQTYSPPHLLSSSTFCFDASRFAVSHSVHLFPLFRLCSNSSVFQSLKSLFQTSLECAH